MHLYFNVRVKELVGCWSSEGCYNHGFLLI